MSHGWIETRAWLNEHRWELAASAARLYPSAVRVAGTGLLADPAWLPETAVPLERVRLEWSEEPIEWAIRGDEAAGSGITFGFARYSDAMRALTPPRVFHNRLCYGLRSIQEPKRTMAFGIARYFANIDIGEAVAHEYADAVRHGNNGDLPLRRAIGDPLDISRRPLPVAISTLVLRGIQEMVLHWRDPAKVASGGGLYQVAPVGVFQPSHDAEWNVANDFDLWRSIQREMHEELLGGSEDYGSSARPIDYGGWEFARTLDSARENGDVTAVWLGAGIDPLTLVADLLCCVSIKACVFDDVFAGLVTRNDEGITMTAPLTRESVDHYSSRQPMQPAGAALLRLAYAHFGRADGKAGYHTRG
jgi:hypothetical protein